MLKRLALKRLEEWKNRHDRKPLLVLGARQVGKTFLLEYFAKHNFNSYHFFDFVRDENLNSLFDGSLDSKSLLARISAYTGKDIDISRDLIVFDEIQHCPKALTSLKYFQQEQPNSFICGSGSLLGISFSNSPFPVGKIERLELAPMTFLEFLYALSEPALADALEGKNYELFSNEAIHKKTWQLLCYYLVTGGLPEVISIFIEHFDKINEAFTKVRYLQRSIIDDYEADFIKYANHENALHLRNVFREVPAQLAKQKVSSSRFVFKGVISESSTFRELEGPIEWLEAANLIFKILFTENSEMPIMANAKTRTFKLYLFDIGLLGCMVGLNPRQIVNYDYGEYKGYFAENFVLQEIKAKQAITREMRNVYTWKRHNTAEIEFLLESEAGVVPIEVKAGINTKAKSLAVYSEMFNPSRSVLLSGNPVLKSKGVTQFLPLYLAAVI